MNEYLYELTKDLDNNEFTRTFARFRKERRIHERERNNCNLYSEAGESLVEEWLYGC